MQDWPRAQDQTAQREGIGGARALGNNGSVGNVTSVWRPARDRLTAPKNTVSAEEKLAQLDSVWYETGRREPIREPSEPPWQRVTCGTDDARPGSAAAGAR